MEEQFNEKEALKLIDGMIATAKKDITENGFNLLLWGWLMFIASISHYLIEQIESPVPSFVTWVACSLIGGIVSTVHNKKEKAGRRVVSYLHESVSYLWQGFGLTMFVILFVTIARSPYAIFPVSLGLMGLGTYVTGRIIKYKWLVYGAYASWLLALVSYGMSYDNQILMYAAGLLLSYIIPGYLLKRDYDRSQLVHSIDQ